MPSLCPFFRSECKESNCVMWDNEDCLIINFLRTFSEEFRASEPAEETNGKVSVPFRFLEPQTIIPEEIKNATAEDIAKEYIHFVETEFPDSDMHSVLRNFSIFLQTKNLANRWNLPPDISVKIQKAENLAREIIGKKIEEQHKHQLEQEKKELKSLIENCVTWSRKYNLNKVTYSDIDAFLLENEITILPETRRSLYSMTNLALKKASH